jgi:23S rRNA pseudouridine1911/1915/1917 synthase
VWCREREETSEFSKSPSVWCADIPVPVNPSGEAAQATAEGPEYMLKNEMWDSGSRPLSLAGACNGYPVLSVCAPIRDSLDDVVGVVEVFASLAPEKLRVRYEDPGFLVVDKPAGVHTAPLRQGEGGTLVDLVIRSYPEVAGLPGRKAVEPGLVHRLDRDTSGLVLVARTTEAFDSLRRAFSSGEARKHYLAACACADGAAESGGTLRIESRFAPCGPGRSKVRAVLPGEKSRKLLREASARSYVTEARVIDRENGRAMLSATLVRGFRHQVRVHLALLGYPILGDPLYGVPVPPGFPARMYLHAARIELRHPASGLPLVVEAPLPEEFTRLFGQAGTAP